MTRWRGRIIAGPFEHGLGHGITLRGAASSDAIGSVARYGSELDGQADGLVMGVLKS